IGLAIPLPLRLLRFPFGAKRIAFRDQPVRLGLACVELSLEALGGFAQLIPLRPQLVGLTQRFGSAVLPVLGTPTNLSELGADAFQLALEGRRLPVALLGQLHLLLKVEHLMVQPEQVIVPLAELLQGEDLLARSG